MGVGDPGLEHLAQRIAAVTGALGGPDVYVRLLDIIGDFVRLSRAQVMYYPRYTQPRYLHSIATPLEEQAFYLEHYHLDPFVKAMSTLSQPAVHQFVKLVEHSGASDLYRPIFYPMTGAADEIAVLLPAFGGGVIGIFVQSPEPYTDRDLGTISALLPMIESFHATQDRMTLLSARGGEHQRGYNRHIILLDADGRETFRSPEIAGIGQDVPEFEPAVADLIRRPSGSSIRLADGTLHIEDLGGSLVSLPKGRVCFFHTGPAAHAPVNLVHAIRRFTSLYGLSPRQSDILELTLLGHSAYNIAQKLVLSEGTVRNHRKLIYDKFNVTSEREIFGMFLKYVAADALPRQS